MQCVKSASCHVRAGGLIALSIIAEGTIRMTREHLHSLLPVVIAAAKDRVSSVRRASCVCLGQWIEHMGAMGMVEHHAIVLPPVLNLIGDSDASVQEAAMYVWECFADHMDPEETRPYFKPLMNQMGCMLRSGQLQHQVMAFTAIGACAVASKVEFRPHFNQTIAVVKQALSSVTDKSKKLLVARSLECCGQIAVAVGANVFRPHLQDCMRFAVMATKQDDTILHDHAIAFFSNLCVCFGKEFASFAQQLLPYLFQTVAVMDILEGTTEQDAELGGAGFAGFEDDEVNDESKLKLSVSTANADKKVSAIRCLGAIADYIPAVYVCRYWSAKRENISLSLSLSLSLFSILSLSLTIPIHTHIHTHKQTNQFINRYATNPTVSQEAVKQLREVMDYWHIEIRCAAIEFAGKLFIAIGGGRPPKESEKKLTFRTGLQELMDDSIREMFETLEHDSETDAVLATCEALQDLTNSYGVAFLEPYMRNLLNLIDLLLKEKAQCQCHEYDEDDEDASYFVEQNESVLNSTFDLLGAIAKSCGPSFEPHFRPLASLMMQYLHTSRPVSIRCSCLGCFAEVLDAIKVAANNGSYADVLLPHIIQGLSAEARGPGQLIDVRNIRRNSSYCVSVLVGACGNHNRILSHFPTILKCLRPLFVVKHKDDLVVRDNAASALSRMVLISPNALPLVEVLPVLLSSLPLRMDEQENKIVYRSIFMLWKQQHPALLKNIPSLLKVLCQALGGVGVTLTPTLQRDLVGLTKSITDKAKNQLSTYAKSLNDSERSVLQKVIQLR
jgi:importin-4